MHLRDLGWVKWVLTEETTSRALQVLENVTCQDDIGSRGKVDNCLEWSDLSSCLSGLIGLRDFALRQLKECWHEVLHTGCNHNVLWDLLVRCEISFLDSLHEVEIRL